MGESAKAGMVTVVLLVLIFFSLNTAQRHQQLALWWESMRLVNRGVAGVIISCLESNVSHLFSSYSLPALLLYLQGQKIQIKKKKKITRDHLAQRQTGGAILGSSYGKITKSVIIHTRTARLL